MCLIVKTEKAYNWDELAPPLDSIIYVYGLTVSGPSGTFSNNGATNDVFPTRKIIRLNRP